MSIPECGIEIRVREEAGIGRERWPLTRGVPLPAGAVEGMDGLRLVNGAGAEVAAQFSVLGTWPDGSAKWILVDFQGDVEAGGEAVYSLQAGAAQAVEECVEIIDGEERVEVCTGPLRFGVGKKSFALFDGVELGARRGGEFAPETELAPRGGGDAWARICESEFKGGTARRIYGMGGDCLASAGAEEYSVAVEEAGPLRAVICCKGAYEAVAPMHHYAGYRPLRFATRIYAYAGKAQVRVAIEQAL